MQSAPLRMDRIEVANYRCFTRLALELDPALTVIVARNGCGKTAVLDAIAVALGPFVGAFDEAKGTHFAAADARLVRNPDTALAEMEGQYPVILSAEGLVDGRAETWQRELAGAKAHTSYAEARPLMDYGKHLQRVVRDAADGRGSPPVLPLVSYYGTGRLWSEMRLTAGKKADIQTSRLVGYTDCLASASRYKSFADWFERLCRAEYEERESPASLAAVRNQLAAIQAAVDTVLRPSGWHSIAFKSTEAGIVAAHDEHGVLPVAWLSDGIRTLIGLAADIAHRAVRLNSHLGSQAVRSTPGIVLIDEVDMHLHPDWQQVIVESLRGAFPRLQFVVTTHSPQVLSTVRRQHVRLLAADGSASIPDDGTYGAESSRVLEEVFGVHTRPPAVPVVSDLRRYLTLIEEGRAAAPEAQALRTALEDALGRSDPDLQLADIRASQLQALGRR